MENEQSDVEKYEKFTWKVKKLSRLNTNKAYPERFFLDGYLWRVLLFPKGYNVDDYISIYLEPVKSANVSKALSRLVRVKLAVFNQLDDNLTFTKGENHWVFPSFMTLTELHGRGKGYIVNDACIIGAEVFVFKSTHEKPVNLDGSHSTVTSLVSNETSKQAEVELVSAALGKVILFLKSKKVKDMNEQACVELQVLWDELKKFKFDNTWLEPQVESALGIRRYVEEALVVEKLKGNVADLELETERIKAKLAIAERNLDKERNLLKAKGIKERDLNSELGSATWKP